MGGKFGKSDVLQVGAGALPAIPPALVGLQPFSLQTGLPQFTVGTIELNERRSDGVIVWSLRGEAGFRYVIERAINSYVWRPLMVVTNASGTTTFIDADSPPAQGVFYRSRILD